jgi:hypothetical protein
MRGILETNRVYQYSTVHRSPLTFHFSTFARPAPLVGIVASRGQAHVISLVFNCAQIAVASNDMGSLQVDVRTY